MKTKYIFISIYLYLLFHKQNWSLAIILRLFQKKVYSEVTTFKKCIYENKSHELYLQVGFQTKNQCLTSLC